MSGVALDKSIEEPCTSHGEAIDGLDGMGITSGPSGLAEGRR
jgi:hypothetical protein